MVFLRETDTVKCLTLIRYMILLTGVMSQGQEESESRLWLIILYFQGILDPI